MSSDCGCGGGKELVDFFNSSRTAFQLHTGDINSWNELKKRASGNSAEELAEVIRLQLQMWKPNVQDHTVDGVTPTTKNDTVRTGEDTITLCTNSRCKASLEGLDRSDLKVCTLTKYATDVQVTIKLWLNDWTPDSVDQCVSSVLNELKTNMVEQLIVALPESFSVDDAEESRAWQSLVMPVWARVTHLQTKEHRVLRAGVADLELDELRAMRQWAGDSAPVIDHYNIDACCEVPTALKEYAREENVLLLTHNDPARFLASDCLQNMQLGISDGEWFWTQFMQTVIEGACAKPWQARWVGRYTVLINSRSVIIKKGYVVRFEKKKCNKS